MRKLFILYFMFVASSMFATTNFFSINAGSWTTIGNWSATSGGGSDGTTPGPSANQVITIQTNITFTGAFTVVANATLIIDAGFTLTVNGNGKFANGSIVVINPGGTLIINGNLKNANNSNQITDNGVINVNGNVTSGNGASIVSTGGNDGALNTTGTVTQTGTSKIFGRGNSCGTPPCSSSADSPMPIELIFFTGQPLNNFIELNWVTATETNNDYFTIEKSLDGVNFETVLIIKGAGNSSVVMSYSGYDKNPAEGLSYYRLKQTDFDGKFTYSGIIAISFLLSGDKISVYPNPAGNNFTVKTSSVEQQFLQIYDISGKMVFAQTIFGNVTIDASGFVDGVYNVRVGSERGVENKKLVILR